MLDVHSCCGLRVSKQDKGLRLQYHMLQESRDPRKIYWLFEMLMENPLNGEGGSFGDAGYAGSFCLSKTCPSTTVSFLMFFYIILFLYDNTYNLLKERYLPI